MPSLVLVPPVVPVPSVVESTLWVLLPVGSPVVEVEPVTESPLVEPVPPAVVPDVVGAPVESPDVLVAPALAVELSSPPPGAQAASTSPRLAITRTYRLP